MGGPCPLHADCDDGKFCNGPERCLEGICRPGPLPCDEEDICHEGGNAIAKGNHGDDGDDHGDHDGDDDDNCDECRNNEECDDGLFCNGVEKCIRHACVPGISPCAEDRVCDAHTDLCRPCIANIECDDGLY